MTSRVRFTLFLTLAIAICVGLSLTPASARRAGAWFAIIDAAAQEPTATAPVGQSVTQLPDGRWLVIGGVGREHRAEISDPHTGAVVPTTGSLAAPRSFHTATVLPDGTVLIVGGRVDDVTSDVAERFDPATGMFTALPMTGSMPRASHTATLLTDGRVMITGGSNGGPGALPTEMWDVQAQTVTVVPQASIDRTGHTAMLTGDGRVRLSGGHTLDGRPAATVEIVDPQRSSVVPEGAVADAAQPPLLTASIPTDASSDVPVNTRLALRFSDALALPTLNADTVTMAGPDGQVPLRLVPAEGGRLLFVWPQSELSDATTYFLTLSGPTNSGGVPLVPASISFTTANRPPDNAAPPEPEEWIPGPSSVHDGWRSHRPPSPWESVAPLSAPPGVTAISGRVLTLDGRPLSDVTLSMDEGGRRASSDRTGRFLLVLNAPTSGRRVLRIDGSTASRRNRSYGYFEYGGAVVAGETNVLPFTIWMPKLDTAHAVTIPSPTTREVVVTTPYIPGLELHIPPHAVLRGRDGKPVTRVTLTPVPVDRPPFPLAKNLHVPV